jgi:ribosomal protein S6--L-glutamate ligase
MPDAVLPRIGATINPYARNLLHHLELSGIRLVSDSRSIRLSSDKCRAYQRLVSKRIPVIESCYVSNFGNFQKAVSELGGYPVVAKTPRGRQGAGVVLVTSAATAEFVADHAQARFQGILVQRYVRPEGRRDIRAFVVGKEAVAAVELRPRRGDFRSNIHLGAEGIPVSLPAGLARLAVRSARALGLEVAGVDMVVEPEGSPLVIEVNHSPGFRGLEALTGTDIASRIIGYVADSHGGGP